MLTNYKWQISKGDVNIETLIVPQTFEKASVKNENLKIKGHKIKWKYNLIIEWLDEIIELNHRIEANGIYVTDIML